MASDRRKFLKGVLGASLALPFLEAFDIPRARGQAASPTKRFVGFFTSCGVEVGSFWPATSFGPLTDASFANNRGISPLAKYKDKLLIPRGLHNSPRGYNFDKAQGGANDHQLGTAARLSAAALDATDHYSKGISVDQEMAKSLHKDKSPALTLGVGRKSNGADGAISYLDSSQPAPRQDNPWLVYQDFVAPGQPNTPMADAILLRRKSVLDMVKSDFDDIQASPLLSKSDRDKLDMHFSTIRDVEMTMGNTMTQIACQLDATGEQGLKAINAGTVRNDTVFPDIGKLQMDVLALALACGHTRVATLMWGSGEGGPVMKWLGQSAEQHLISHRVTAYGGENPLAGAAAMLQDIDRWYAQQFLYFLDKLSAYSEGGASLLDNSAVVWLNELSDGKVHSYLDLPFVIAGSASGYFKQGQYIKLTTSNLGGTDPIYTGEDAPHNKLLTTLLNAVGAKKADGAPYDNFGQFGKPGVYQELLV